MLMNALLRVLTPLRWLRKILALLRELRTHEQGLLSVRDLTARELRHNAEAAENYEQQQWSIGNVQQSLQFGKWDHHGAEWSALRKRNEALWHEVADAYEALRKTQAFGGAPPNSEMLYDLARRVGEAEL